MRWRGADGVFDGKHQLPGGLSPERALVLEPGLLGVGAFAVVGLGGGRTGRSGDRVAPWAARPDGAGSAPA